MDAKTYELLNTLHKDTERVLKVATTTQLREIHTRMNSYYRRLIDAEIASRDAASPLQPEQNPRYSGEWKSRPGTIARFLEEDETIHGIN